MTTKHKPSPTLKGILAKMLERAELQPGANIQKRLTNNLQVNVKVIEGIVVLLISRSSVYPSQTEWRTILRHLPYQVETEPTRIGKSGRCWLRGRWSLQTDLQLHPNRTKSHPAEINAS